MSAAPKIYFEDFHVGMTRERDLPVLSEDDIIEFASKYDPQAFHTDRERARDSLYGGLIASGWHTVSLCMRAICEAYLLEAASLGSPGVQDLRWLKPVRAGDRLRMKMTVEAAKPSQSKPDRGSVLHRWELFDDKNELVMDMTGWGMFRRRPA